MMVGRERQLPCGQAAPEPGRGRSERGTHDRGAQDAQEQRRARTCQLSGPSRRDRLHRRHRRQRPDGARLRPDRSGARSAAARSRSAARTSRTRPSASAALLGHEPHPRGPPQARPGAGLLRWRTISCCSAYFEPEFTDKAGFLRRDNIRELRRRAHRAVRRPLRTGPRHAWPAACPAATSRRPSWPARSTRIRELLVAVQPTRGLDVGAIEYIHKQLRRASATRARRSCWFRWSWTRSWTCPTASSSCTRVRSSASSIPKTTTAGGAGPVHGRRQERRGEGMKEEIF